MSEQITIPAEKNSFKEFNLKNRHNRRIVTLAAIAMVVQFTIFKYLYPYANFIHDDSFSYIEAAYKNLDIDTYMIGYSKFLRLFSVFTSSDTALVAFQYIFIQASALFFISTLFYFYNPAKVTRIILLCFTISNPLFLYLANLISSDALFLALSFTWFGLLLWIIHRPSKSIVIFHCAVLFVAFTVRYNAVIYPFIAAFAFWISKLPLQKKLYGIMTSVLVCTFFILYTGNKYKTLTGVWQYSPFSGWQLINNAMYTYRYVDSADRKPVPARFKKLNDMICTYFDTTRDTRRHPEETLMASTVYMWDQRSPLYKYRNKLFEKDTSVVEFKRWASMGPFYKDYGLYIIKQYPWHYIRYFLWPNANKYYAPPLEFLKGYNMGRDSVSLEAQEWFRYRSPKIATRIKGLKSSILEFYPILTGVMNMIFLGSLLCFIILNGFRSDVVFRSGILLGTILWLVNAGFTIFSSSAALRFQAFPIIMISTFALMLVDCLCKIILNKQIENQKSDFITESVTLS